MTSPRRCRPLHTLSCLLVAASLFAVGCQDDPSASTAPEGPVAASSTGVEEAADQAASETPPVERAAGGDAALVAKKGATPAKPKPKVKPKPKARPVKPRAAERAKPTPKRRTGGRLLRVSHLFGNDKEDDRGAIRQYFDYTGYLTDAEFPGQEPGLYYNAYRLRTDREGVFGYGIQVWKTPSGDDAMERFDALFAQSVGGVKGREIADRSFRAQHDGLRSLAFVSRKQESVVWLTCDVSLCSFDQMLSFARSVKAKL